MNGIYTLRGTWKFIHFEKNYKVKWPVRVVTGG
jgi:hypothetical protein